MRGKEEEGRGEEVIRGWITGLWKKEGVEGMRGG